MGAKTVLDEEWDVLALRLDASTPGAPGTLFNGVRRHGDPVRERMALAAMAPRMARALLENEFTDDYCKTCGGHLTHNDKKGRFFESETPACETSKLCDELRAIAGGG